MGQQIHKFWIAYEYSVEPMIFNMSHQLDALITEQQGVSWQAGH